MIFALIPNLFFADIRTLNVDGEGRDISEVPCFINANYGSFCVCHTQHEYLF